MTRSRSLALAATLALATGCAGGEGLPRVDFDRMEIRDLDWETIETDMMLDVYNPAPLQVELARFDYTLTIDGHELFWGDDGDGATLAAAGDSELALPVDLAFAEVFAVVQAARGEDTLPFEIEGTVGFETPWGPLDLPVSADGDMPALRVPEVAFSRLRLAGVDGQAASVDVDLAVDNAHGSELRFTDLDYQISLAGAPVGSGAVASLGGVAGATEGIVTVPVDLSYAGAGEALLSLLDGERMQVRLSGSTDVETPFGTIGLALDEQGRLQLD